MFRFVQRRRRAGLRARPFPAEWVAVLEANVPVYRRLPADLRAQLHGHVHVLLAEKKFEGCNGIEITDPIRVTIAAQAALLLLNRVTDYYPHLVTILVYPSVFYADVADADGEIISEYTEDRSGESWDLGVVILSWEDTVRYASTGRSGYNVVLHEFAHQLDMENGEMDGVPKLADRAARERWVRVFTDAYDRFERAESSGRRTLIDSYAEGDPSEFFAVVTESFFERSRALHREQPDLYEVLSAYYAVDPAAWDDTARSEPHALARAPRRSRRRGKPRRGG